MGPAKAWAAANGGLAFCCAGLAALPFLPPAAASFVLVVATVWIALMFLPCLCALLWVALAVALAALVLRKDVVAPEAPDAAGLFSNHKASLR